MSEKDVEDEALRIILGAEGIVLVFYSAQNIERLISLHAAARRASRTFVYDLYGATIAAATGREDVPLANHEGVRVYLPDSQRRRVINSGEFERTRGVRAARIFPDEVAARASHLVFSFRQSMSGELERAGCLVGAKAIWSLWPGYLTEPSGARLRQWVEQKRIPLQIVHASGHAPVEDLKRLVDALQPTRIVPIHTVAPELFPGLFGPTVELHPDGEWFSL